MGERHQKAALSRRQAKFVEQFAHTGNATASARAAGYKDGPGIRVTANRDLLTNPNVKRELARVEAEIAANITPDRVKRRLHEISYASQEAGQFGPAVRSEELLGKSCGMWIEQSIALTGTMNDTHIAALLDIARQRQAEPIDLVDDSKRDTDRE
jgi:hypothetical protein